MSEIVYRKLTDIKKLPNNPRTIKKDDMERLKKSIKDNPDYFEARPIILSNRTGELVILAGNQRYEAAKALKMDEVPTFLLEGLTEAREREIIIRDNVSNGDWDMDALANEWDTQELTDWGVDINWDEPEQEVIEDEAPEISDEPADSVMGGVYQLGRHRLMCSDSTDEKCVQTLIGGGSIDMVFTDPPYNVAFNGRSGKFDVIENDDLPEEEFDELIRKTCTIIEKIKPKNTYIWCNWKFYGILQQYFKPKACIVWAKNNFGMGKGYRHQHEFCMFDGEIDETITNETDLWQEKKDTNYEHPTQKPISLCARALKNTKNAKCVLDLFGGSGSTLIACEQLGRKCYMMELDPKYCDVIRKRYWKFVTGSEEGWQDGTRAAI